MICAGVLLMGAAPALSQAPQSRILPASADAPFAHAHSGLALPPTLIGLPRFEVRELEAPQLDLWARYRSSDDEELTVYVYRATAGSVPVWFDRSAWAIENRPSLGKAKAIAPARAIAPPNATPPSGLIQSWALAGGSYSGTSLMIAPIGEWLVKLRYSTTKGDGAAAEAKALVALAALRWPATPPAATAAAAIADCPDTIAFKGEAKTAKVDGASALLGAFLSGAAPRIGKPVTAPKPWCRDPAKVEVGGVYRLGAATDAYLLALSDAGRGVFVGPDTAAALTEKGKGDRSWSVNLILPGRTINFPPQDRLPSPARMIELLRGGAVSSATTWGDKPQVNITPVALK